MHILKQSFRPRSLPAACWAALALGACIAGDGWSFDEVARVPAPSGRLEAVLVEENGGATTNFGYRVFVVPRGQVVRSESRDAVASLYGAMRSARAYGANLRWRAPGELSVEFAAAQRDSVLQPAVRVAGEAVRVTLRPGIPDPTAPGGGMLYNRQHPAR